MLKVNLLNCHCNSYERTLHPIVHINLLTMINQQILRPLFMRFHLDQPFNSF